MGFIYYSSFVVLINDPDLWVEQNESRGITIKPKEMLREIENYNNTWILLIKQLYRDYESTEWKTH